MSILDVIRKVQNKTPTQYINLIQPIIEYLEFRDAEPRRMMLKPAKKIRLKPDLFQTVPIDSREGQAAEHLYHQSLEFMRHHYQSTPLLYLIQAAVLSENRTLQDIRHHVGLDAVSPARFRRIIDHMAELGQMLS